MIEIKNKTWDDVTIEMWQEINSIDTDSEVTRMIEQISILTNIDSEQIRQLKIEEFKKMQSQLAFMYQQPKPDIKVKFELDGKWYGMIPQLDFITAGEWLDAETWKDDSIGNMHFYAAMLYRPITKDFGDMYEIEPHKSQGFMERANLFKQKLSITTIFGLVLFFSTSVIKPIEIIEDYLNQIEKDKKKNMKMSQTQTPTKTRKEKRSKKGGDSMI